MSVKIVYGGRKTGDGKVTFENGKHNAAFNVRTASFSGIFEKILKLNFKKFKE